MTAICERSEAASIALEVFEDLFSSSCEQGREIQQRLNALGLRLEVDDNPLVNGYQFRSSRLADRCLDMLEPLQSVCRKFGPYLPIDRDSNCRRTIVIPTIMVPTVKEFLKRIANMIDEE